MKNYYEEALKEAFEDAKITASNEQINIVVSWIESAVENKSMACGYDSIPDPRESEIDKLKTNHKKELERLENQINIYRNSVAERRNVDVSDVFIEDNRVMYKG